MTLACRFLRCRVFAVSATRKGLRVEVQVIRSAGRVKSVSAREENGVLDRARTG